MYSYANRAVALLRPVGPQTCFAELLFPNSYAALSMKVGPRELRRPIQMPDMHPQNGWCQIFGGSEGREFVWRTAL